MLVFDQVICALPRIQVFEMLLKKKVIVAFDKLHPGLHGSFLPSVV